MLKRITQTATRFTVPSPSVILPFYPIPSLKLSSPDRSAAPYAARSGGIAAHSHDFAHLPLLPFFFFPALLWELRAFCVTCLRIPPVAHPFEGRGLPRPIPRTVIPTEVPRRLRAATLSSRPEQRRLMPLRSGGIAAHSHDLAHLPLRLPLLCELCVLCDRRLLRPGRGVIVPFLLFSFPLYSRLRQHRPLPTLRSLCGPSVTSVLSLSLFLSSLLRNSKLTTDN